MSSRAIAVLVVVMLVVSLAAKTPQGGAPLTLLKDQKAELRAFWLPTPVQKCTNWAWAVAVEAMLRSQQVTIKQNSWVMKANLGEVCVDALPSLEQLAKVINGAYVLEDGRHVRLQTHFIAGAATIPDDLIAPLRRGRPVLLFWKARALVVRAIVYDEYIYPNNQRMFAIKEIKLVDPLLTGKQREFSFTTAQDDTAEIGGTLEVVVIPDKVQSW